MKFHVKPVVVDAVQWVGTNIQEVVDFIAQSMPGGFSSVRFEFSENAPTSITVSTIGSGAILTADSNDYIVRDAAGKVSTVKPDVFVATYDPEPVS